MMKGGQGNPLRMALLLGERSPWSIPALLHSHTNHCQD